MATTEPTATEQARAADEAVLVVRSTDRAAITVSGPERISWLNGLVTCDLAKLGPDDAAYGLLVEKKGKIQVDFFAVPSCDRDPKNGAVALAVPAEHRETVFATLDHHLIMENAEVLEANLVFFIAYGPKSEALLEVAPASAFAGKVNVLGSGGAAFAVPAADAEAFEAKLAEACASLGGALGDEASFEAVRVERGLPRFGKEFDTTLYPQEAALEKLAVSFSKGCYLGQEVVYMLENRGHVKKKLVPLDVEGEGPLDVGAAVTTAAGDSVGEVRSSVIAPTRGTPVAIAMVKWAHSNPGTELVAGGRVARVRG